MNNEGENCKETKENMKMNSEHTSIPHTHTHTSKHTKNKHTNRYDLNEMTRWF